MPTFLSLSLVTCRWEDNSEHFVYKVGFQNKATLKIFRHLSLNMLSSLTNVELYAFHNNNEFRLRVKYPLNLFEVLSPNSKTYLWFLPYAWRSKFRTPCPYVNYCHCSEPQGEQGGSIASRKILDRILKFLRVFVFVVSIFVPVNIILRNVFRPVCNVILCKARPN